MFGSKKFKLGHQTCEVSVATAAFGTVIGGAIIGAVVGGGYEAVTGGSVLKGVLGGAVLGAAGGAAWEALGPAMADGTMSVADAQTLSAAVDSGGLAPEAGTQLAQMVADGSMTSADAASIAANNTALASGADASSLGLSDKAVNALKSQAGQKLVGALIQGVGTVYAANAAGQVGQQQAEGAMKAAGVLEAGATTAARVQSEAATTAAGQKVAGANNAIGTVDSTLQKQTALDQPAISAGTDALKTLSAGLEPGGQFNKPFTMADAQNMPAYKFALEQGKEQINNASGAGGTQLSSGNTQAMTKFAEGTAAQFENQAFNQWLAQNNLTLGALQDMVKTGQISTQQLTTSLEQAGVNTANLQQYIGGATAQGTTGAAAATATGITGAAGAKAAGIEGATGANTAALANQANIITTGVQGVATQLAGALPASTSTVAQTTPIPMSSAAPLVTGSGVSTAGYAPPAIPTDASGFPNPSDMSSATPSGLDIQNAPT